MGSQVACGLEKKASTTTLVAQFGSTAKEKGEGGGPGEQACGAQDVAEGDPG
jgi:hypothetical protein